MEKGVQKIVWSKQAGESLEKIFKYLVRESFEVAVKIISNIEKQVAQLPANPEYFPPDLQKRNNNGSYRCFTKYRYRVSYRVARNYIKIIRIRHTSMNPASY